MFTLYALRHEEICVITPGTSLCAQINVLYSPVNATSIWLIRTICIFPPDVYKRQIQIQSRNSQHAAELLWIQYSEELLAELSEEGTDLLKSMEVVPFSCISVPTDGGTAAILKNLFTRLERSEQEKDDFGARLFEKNMLSLMIVIILRACIVH